MLSMSRAKAEVIDSIRSSVTPYCWANIAEAVAVEYEALLGS
jgi:hypothetical protein